MSSTNTDIGDAIRSIRPAVRKVDLGPSQNGQAIYVRSVKANQAKAMQDACFIEDTTNVDDTMRAMTDFPIPICKKAFFVTSAQRQWQF